MTDLFVGALSGLLIVSLVLVAWCLSWCLTDVFRPLYTRAFNAVQYRRAAWAMTHRRLRDVLWISRPEGDIWPRWFGLVSKFHTHDGGARGTIIPFNLLIGWGLYTFWKIRFGWAPPPSWRDVQRAYVDGQADAWEKAWVAGQEGGFVRGVEFQKQMQRG